MRSLPLRLTLPLQGELLCRINDFGKKIPFVNSCTGNAVKIAAYGFPKFDNWNF
jgi:hypothetical protein